MSENKQERQKTRYELETEIKEELIEAWEKEHGPTHRKLTPEEREKKIKENEEDGYEWNEDTDGFTYTDAAREFIFGSGENSLDAQTDKVFEERYPDIPEYSDKDLSLDEEFSLEKPSGVRDEDKESGSVDLHSSISESDSFIGGKIIDLEDRFGSEAKETRLNSGETKIEKQKEKKKEKRERDPDLPKSKKLAEMLESLDDQGKIEFLQKFRGIKASVLVEGENGARERQYIRLKDGEEFNLNGKEELTFEFFDKYGDIILNEDGSPKTKVQKISDIKYRDWKPYDFYHIGKEQHHYNDVLEKIDDDNFNYANSVTYENETTDKDSRVMRIPTESRGYTEKEGEEWKNLLSEHESLLKNLEDSYAWARERFSEAGNEKHAAFFEERLSEIAKYRQSRIVEAIKAGDVNLKTIQKEVEVLRSRLEAYQESARVFDFRQPKKEINKPDQKTEASTSINPQQEAQQEAEKNEKEAIEQEIDKLIDGSNLPDKQKLELKKKETILVSSWPATIEMNRYQAATCIYQGVDLRTVKVKGFIPLVSQKIVFSLTNGEKQELDWDTFFNTIDANYRDNLLPAIKSHLKGGVVEDSEPPVEMELVEPPLKDNNSGEQEKLDEKKEDRDDSEKLNQGDSSQDAQESNQPKNDERRDIDSPIESKPESMKDAGHIPDDEEVEQLAEQEKLDNEKDSLLIYIRDSKDILDILFEHEDEFDYSPDEMLTLPAEDAQELYQKIVDKVNGIKTIEGVQNYRKVLEGVIGKHLKGNKSPEKSQEEKEKELKDLKLKIKAFYLKQSKENIAKIKDKQERDKAQERDNKFMKEAFKDIDEQIDIAVLQDMYKSITSE